MQLNMTTEPTLVTFSAPAFVYLEKRGPFLKNAPLAWQEFMPLIKDQFAPDQIETGAGLSRIDHTLQGDEAYIYQAGLLLKAMPDKVPPFLTLRTLPIGNYASFMLTGSYSQLPEAYPAAFAILDRSAHTLRNDFCIEKYITNPATTAEDQLKTELLFPVV